MRRVVSSPQPPAQSSPAQPSSAAAAWRSLTKTDSGQKKPGGELQGCRPTDLNRTWTLDITADTNIGTLFSTFYPQDRAASQASAWTQQN